ncbi:MAG TPA: ABC transporter ATP-binding protein [Pyrinomonadaceae bacterium]|jgi:lipoprotein-releasing system ATP-binding protein|nr:ABC transporter ATP-binding protein [Pyrinomonadaceae bacterium]
MMNVVDLRKSFVAPNGERIEVLRGVDFTAADGESIAITGPSGSGKSTLLHLLGNLETPDHGTITLDGAGEQRQSIGFVFQFHYLLPDLSAVENVALPLLIARWSKNKASSRALDLLRETGLADRADHPISHLSGGEQQRVAVARALITEPKLLLADEPTGNLDEAISEQIGRTLVDYSRKYSAITIIATHSPRLAGLCDRSLVLEGGRTHQI